MVAGLGTKDALVSKLGSEQAAIALMAKQPDLLPCPRYDGWSPKMLEILEPEELASANRASGPPGALIAGVAVAVGAVALLASSALPQ